MTINLEKLNNYKQEITFLINRKGKIFYHKIDLFHDHEDLLIENKDEIGEFDVCRLVYDPNSEDASFCGIPGISASMNVMFDNLPFELKSTHLNAIENFVKDYENIVQYAEEHKDEYNSDDATQFIRSMNRMYAALYKNDKNKRASWEQVCKTWYKWQQKYPVLKWLNADEECINLDQSGLVGTFFESKDQSIIKLYRIKNEEVNEIIKDKNQKEKYFFDNIDINIKKDNNINNNYKGNQNNKDINKIENKIFKNIINDSVQPSLLFENKGKNIDDLTKQSNALNCNKRFSIYEFLKWNKNKVYLTKYSDIKKKYCGISSLFQNIEKI